MLANGPFLRDQHLMGILNFQNQGSRRQQRGRCPRVQVWQEDQGHPQDGPMLDQRRRVQPERHLKTETGKGRNNLKSKNKPPFLASSLLEKAFEQ